MTDLPAIRGVKEGGKGNLLRTKSPPVWPWVVQPM